MVREKVIQQLLEWIECHLEQAITIDDVARKSGYSRRNIQLLFRNIVHMPLGMYIRKRKLCRAAVLVRLSTKPMLDIAISLQFDSQQSFSREFKKVFGCSPREYRHRDYWDLDNILPPYFLSRDNERPKCKLIQMPKRYFYGNSFKYDIELINTPSEQEIKFRGNQLSKDLKKWEMDVFYITSFKPSTKSFDLLSVETFAGTEIKDNEMDTLKERCVSEGLYASFHYDGCWEDYANWVRSLYLSALPAEGLVRVNGSDIEHFSHDDSFFESENNHIVCDMFIPVRSKMN